MNSVLMKLGNMLPQLTNIDKFSMEQVNLRGLDVTNELIRESYANVKTVEYMGLKRLNPEETYKSMMSGGKTSKVMNVDTTESSFYKVELKFRMRENGDIIRTKLALPYLDNFGRLISSDVKYLLKPVLMDNVLSPHSTGIFTKLLITKFNMSTVGHIMSINGNKLLVTVIYADNNKTITGNADSKLGRVVCPIAFYGLSTYGFRGMIEKAIPGTKVDIVNLKNYTHDEENGILYTDPSNEQLGIVVHIKESQYFVNNLIASIFYILHHSGRHLEFMNYCNGNNLEDEKDFWIMLFGRFYYKGTLTFDKSTSEIIVHLNKIASYLDVMSKRDLKSIGIEVDNYVDLMMVMLDIFNITILKHKDISNDIQNHKKLVILYYILNPVIFGINSSQIDIVKRETTRQYPLTTREVTKIISDNLREKLIHTVVKSTRRNLSVLLASGVTDNLLDYLLTSDEQNRGDGVYVNKHNSFPAALRNVLPHHFIVGSMHDISKKAPTPLLELSPFLKVDVNGNFIVDKALNRIASESYKKTMSNSQYKDFRIDTGNLDDLDIELD